MARKTKEEKRVEAACDAAFQKHGQRRMFDIFDLGKITKAGKDAAARGEDIDAAVKAACDLYEKK